MTPTASLGGWIACHTPNPHARLRLFCFPYAGGSAPAFRTWTAGLPAKVEVCPVQLPGRGSRLSEPPFTRLAPLVETLAHVLSPLLDKPFAFFGHSLGALISFELARQLRRQYGVHPVRLFVSAASAPQIPPASAPLHALSDSALLKALCRLNGTPAEVLEHAELMQLMLPTLRADFAVYETYVYSAEPPLNCPVAAFGGLQDHRVGRSDLSAWRDQTCASFSLRMFPGDHFFLNTDQRLLLPALCQELHQDC